MQLNQISSWKKYDNINNDVQNEFVKSWLLELGPITKRISSRHESRRKGKNDGLKKYYR